MHSIREKLKANALQLAAQLPENRKDAIAVIGYLNELIEWGATGKLSTGRINRQGAAVVRFERPGGISPKRRANSIGRPSGLPK